MAVLDEMKTKAGTSGELLQLFRKRKRLWLVPMIAVLLLLGVLFIVLAEASAVAPFIYALF
jgi:biopolymer transport protein ExbD